MSANQMDYFEKKPGLDLKQFFEAKGMKLDGRVPAKSAGAAPPPKDLGWCATDEDTEEEEQQ